MPNFRRFAGLRPAPRLGLPPQTRCASGAKYGPFTVTPAIVAVRELIHGAVYNSPIAQIRVKLYLWEYITPRASPPAGPLQAEEAKVQSRPVVWI